MKSMKKLKAELLANPAVRQAYDAQAPEFELARELITASTQGDVAVRMESLTAAQAGQDQAPVTSNLQVSSNVLA